MTRSPIELFWAAKKKIFNIYNRGTRFNRLESKESLKKKGCMQILERMRGREVVGDRRRKGGVTGQRREVREEVTQPNTLNEKNKCQIQIQKPSQIQIQLNEKNKY